MRWGLSLGSDQSLGQDKVNKCLKYNLANGCNAAALPPNNQKQLHGCVGGPGRLSSQCASGRRTARRSSTDMDWYGCDSLEQSQHLMRSHSVAADDDQRTSPPWCEHGTRLPVNSPAVSQQSRVAYLLRFL